MQHCHRIINVLCYLKQVKWPKYLQLRNVQICMNTDTLLFSPVIFTIQSLQSKTDQHSTRTQSYILTLSVFISEHQQTQNRHQTCYYFKSTNSRSPTYWDFWNSGYDFWWLEVSCQWCGRSIDHHLSQVVEQFLGAILWWRQLEQLRVLINEVCVNNSREKLTVFQHVQQEWYVCLKQEQVTIKQYMIQNTENTTQRVSIVLNILKVLSKAPNTLSFHYSRKQVSTLIKQSHMN